MYGWLINGIPVLAKVLMLIMLSLAFVLPLFMNKSFYCAHVCPYGAAQELMGKLNKKKFKIPSKLIKCLKYIKMVFFYAIVLAVILKFEFDLASLEPFSAFLVSVASPMVIVLATVFLIISIFVPKAWCNYFCPTGYLLDVFRKGKI
jgi:polyferredoxin